MKKQQKLAQPLNKPGSSSIRRPKRLLLLIAIPFLLVSIGLFAYLTVQQHFMVPATPGVSVAKMAFRADQIAFVAYACYLIVLVLVISILGPRSLEEAISALVFLILGIILTAPFLWQAYLSPVVIMTQTSFARADFAHSDLYLNDGDALYIQNPADGVEQTLCFGIDQVCQPVENGAYALNKGIKIEPGQIVTIKLKAYGDYTITSKNTPHMNLHVIISIPDPDSGGD